MIEIGKVVKISRSGLATIRFDRKLACENCNMCLKPRDENYVEIRVQNILGASVGDNVKVEIGDKSVVSAAILVYLFPLLIFGIVLAFTYKLKLLICLLSSFFALLGCFLIVGIIDRKIIKKKKSFAPKMTEIMPKENLIVDEKREQV